MDGQLVARCKQDTICILLFDAWVAAPAARREAAWAAFEERVRQVMQQP